MLGQVVFQTYPRPRRCWQKASTSRAICSCELIWNFNLHIVCILASHISCKQSCDLQSIARIANHRSKPVSHHALTPFLLNDPAMQTILRRANNPTTFANNRKRTACVTHGPQRLCFGSRRRPFFVRVTSKATLPGWCIGGAPFAMRRRLR